MVCGAYDVGTSGLTGEYVDDRRRGNVDGIDVIEFRLHYGNSQSLIRRTIVFLKFAARSIGVAMREDFDLVFATSTPLTAGIPGICARLIRRKPFVFEVRDLWPELPKQMGVIRNPLVLWGMSILEWLSYRTADACIALSPGIADGIRRVTGKSKSIAMIPNGCDLDRFGPSGLPRRADRFYAVFPGAHGEANDLGAVLKVARELKRRNREDIRFILIGSGKLKPSLVEQARADKLDNIEFRDPMPKTELAAELRRMHVGLQLLANVPGFYYGTSPNKFFDYLASGLPVIVNYPGWVANLISDAKCGQPVPPDDPMRFADSISYLADNPQELERFGRNARRLAEESFDRKVLAGEFVNFLEKTAGK